MNVLGDSYGAGIVYHLCKAELQQQDEEREQQERVRKASAVDGRLIQLEHAIIDMELSGRRVSEAPTSPGQSALFASQFVVLLIIYFCLTGHFLFENTPVFFRSVKREFEEIAEAVYFTGGWLA